ncbi:MAG: phosphoenolpyruvate--protein phosphotransferase [Propioniciclava sp.]
MSPVLIAPVSGIMTPLDTVPDPAFAQKLVGDGVSIDPIEEAVVAPCAGTITYIHPAHHALTLTTDDGVEILIHVGLDTVVLKGQGFDIRVHEGDQVVTGDELLHFDTQTVIEGAQSLLTQVLISNLEAVSGLLPAEGLVSAGTDVVLTYQLTAGPDPAAEVAPSGPTLSSAPVQVLNPLGLHARPAALLTSQAKAFTADVRLRMGEATVNAKSLTSVMTLGVSHGDLITVEATGADATAALERLVQAITDGLGEDPVPTPLAPAAPTPGATIPSSGAPASPVNPDLITGVGASPGIAVGTVVRLAAHHIEVDPQPSGAVADELAVLEGALERARAQLAALEQETASRVGQEQAEIFAAQRELLDDPELTGASRTAIQQGQGVGYAWKQTYTAFADSLAALTNELLAARATDIRDVGMRVLTEITGQFRQDVVLPSDAVVVARDLTASDTASLDPEHVAAFVVVDGGATSHSAILAQSLGIPAVAGAEERVLDLAPGTRVILDGDAGTLQLNISAADLDTAREQQTEAARRRRENLTHASEPARTRDGSTVEVVANIGSVADAQAALAHGAEGVGLLRSEFVFMNRATFPTEAEQADLYAAVATALGPGHKLIVRTLDVGGDKPLPYLPIPPEENPFLGQRGIRVGLEREDILRPQLRAILTAASGGGAAIHVMFPMIATLEEFRRAKAILAEERHQLGAPEVPVGIMVEIPSVAVMARQFAREADFFSIGTNDLTQYTLAMDRGHPTLAPQCDPFNPGILGLIKQAVDGAHAEGIWVGVCGGLASNPQATAALIGLGVDELSAVVSTVPDIKAQIRALTLTECQELAARLLHTDTAAQVRTLLSGTPD